MEMTLKIGGLDFAAGQRHSLENPLIPECRFLIWLFRRAAALGCVLLARVQVLFSHKKELPLPRAQSPRPSHEPRLRATSFAKRTTETG